MLDSNLTPDAPPNVLLLLLSMLALLWLSGSFVLWTVAGVKLFLGKPILEPEKRSGVGASFSDLLLAVGIFGLTAALLAPLLIPPAAAPPAVSVTSDSGSTSDTESAKADTETAAELEAKTEPETEDAEAVESAAEQAENLPQKPVQQIDFDRLIPSIAVQAIATVLSTTLTLLWISLRGIPLSAYGFLPCWRDLRIGIAAIVMLLPPVYMLQSILVYFIKYEHPLIDVLNSPQTWGVIAIMVTSSTIVAPLTEEFFFRGLFQGWLEHLNFRPQRNDASSTILTPDIANEADSGVDAESDGDIAASDRVTEDESKPSTPPGEASQGISRDGSTIQHVARWPLVISSLVFAAAHAGQGPAPISLFFLALGLGYLYRQTGRIWASVVVHVFLNGLTTIVTLAASQ
ncbi:CPBP family intramembrane glutamic endopeptidase [Planctomycetaceae bacterium SH139]